MVEREVGRGDRIDAASGRNNGSGIFPIKKMAADCTSLFLSNVIKPTLVLLSSNKRQYLLSEKFLMKTAASFSYI